MTVAPIRSPPSSATSIRSSGSPRDVDEQGGPLDAGLHQVDEVGAAAEEAGVGVGGEQGDRAGRVGRALVAELPHRPLRLAGRRCDRAATTSAYAPQRHRLPLIRSRISSSVERRLGRTSSVTALGQPRACLDHRDGRADLARRAVAALVAVEVEERLLHRMQPPPSATPSIVVTSRASAATASWRQEYPAPVEQHGAGAALPVVAALLRAGQIEPLAQGVEQGGAVVERQDVVAVDAERDLREASIIDHSGEATRVPR